MGVPSGDVRTRGARTVEPPLARGFIAGFDSNRRINFPSPDVPTNEVEAGQFQVLAARTAAAPQRRASAVVGHTQSDLTKTTACASADRVSDTVSAVRVARMCDSAPNLPDFQRPFG